MQGAAGTTYVRVLLIVFGALSLLLAALFALRQVNYKRLLAYSSIEHIGIVSLGIGIGGPIAAYGAFLHVLAHAAGKSLAFFGAGELLSRYDTRSAGGVRGVMRVAPLTGFMVLAAAVAISGMPPFGLFRSEVLIVTGGFQKSSFFLAGLVILLANVAFVGLYRTFHRMVLSRAAREADRAQPPPAAAADGGGDDRQLPRPARARPLDSGSAQRSAAQRDERDRRPHMSELRSTEIAYPRQLAPAASELVEAGGRLMTLFVVPDESGGELVALVRDGEKVKALRVSLSDGASYPSLTPEVPAAHWHEREIHDLHGIEPIGHPRLEPLLRRPMGSGCRSGPASSSTAGTAGWAGRACSSFPMGRFARECSRPPST